MEHRWRALLVTCVLGLLAALGGCTDDGRDGSDGGAASSSSSSTTTLDPCGGAPIHQVRLALPPDFDPRPVPGHAGGVEVPEICAVHYVSTSRSGTHVQVTEGEPAHRLTDPRSTGQYRWGTIHEGLMALPTTPTNVFVVAYGVGEAEFERMLAT